MSYITGLVSGTYIIGIARPFPTHQARGLFSLPDNTCQSPHSWHTGHLRLRKVVP